MARRPEARADARTIGGVIIDLSNNNAALAGGKTRHDFRRARTQGGQKRVYLKRVGDEGRNHRFVDKAFPILRTAALRGGMKVGAYDFVHPIVVTPRESAELLLKALDPFLPLRHGRDLRPAIDVEVGSPSVRVGKWVTEHASILRHETGRTPVIYGSPFFLEACRFEKVPGPLWLADFGLDDGREWPVKKVPRPWRRIAAHQFTSRAKVAGIVGLVDLSHVLVPSLIDA